MPFLRRRKKRHISRSSERKKSWRLQKKRSGFLKIRQFLLGKFIFFLILFIIIFVSSYIIFFTTLFHIKDISVETEYKDINVPLLQKFFYEKMIDENILFFDLRSLENESYERFPDVSSSSCTRNIFFKKISCEVLGYELVAVMKNKGKKYYINENGVVISFDNRKLGLPIFELILNPIFADIESQPDAGVLIGDITKSIEDNAVNSPFGPFFSSSKPTDEPSPDPSSSAQSSSLLSFIKPNEEPPIEDLILSKAKKDFQVTVGKKILDPHELQHILTALEKLEKILSRKVIRAQYVQVAGELSLTSRPSPSSEEKQSEKSDNATENPSEENPDHEFTILLDLRRNLDTQFLKLKKMKEVIDFTEVTQIDLSVDGKKVFYR